MRGKGRRQKAHISAACGVILWIDIVIFLARFHDHQSPKLTRADRLQTVYSPHRVCRGPKRLAVLVTGEVCERA